MLVLLVLDEATSAVDSLSEKLIQQTLERLFKSKTVLVIAHRISTVQNADRILALKDGVIVESGTHAELMQNKGFYSDLYHMQFEHL